MNATRNAQIAEVPLRLVEHVVLRVFQFVGAADYVHDRHGVADRTPVRLPDVVHPRLRLALRRHLRERARE
jgi:hypothetical protein